MILPFSCVGEGSCSASCSTGSTRSLSPNTSLKIRAIWRCWSKGQCSSMDRISGNLREKHHYQNDDLWLCEACVILNGFMWKSAGSTECIGRKFDGTRKDDCESRSVCMNMFVSHRRAAFYFVLTPMWQRRAHWWLWPHPQTWSWLSWSSRGRWLALRVLPSSPLGIFKNTDHKWQRALSLQNKFLFVTLL